jgi:hypothetical protein
VDQRYRDRGDPSALQQNIAHRMHPPYMTVW